jgi:acyl dehydratase
MKAKPNKGKNTTERYKAVFREYLRDHKEFVSTEELRDTLAVPDWYFDSSTFQVIFYTSLTHRGPGVTGADPIATRALTNPRTKRETMSYFEDLDVGESDSFGHYEVTDDEITDFAEAYDPQPFHVDHEAASESMFGGLVASGWHTASMTMRMLVEEQFTQEGALGAVGVDELRWPNPVRPGDVLHVGAEVLEKRRDYRPGVGLVRSRVETIDDDGEVVQSFISRVLHEQRE